MSLFLRLALLVSIIYPVVFGQERIPLAMPSAIKDARVEKSVEHQRGETSVILEMIENPGIPDPPPPPEPLTAAEREAILARPDVQARIAEHKEMNLIFLSATIVDGRRTLLRWWHEKEEYRAWSSINFKFFQGTSHFKIEDDQFLLFMGIGEISSTNPYYNAETYKPPKLPGKGVRYLLSQGDATDAEAMECIDALHEHFRVNKKEMKRQYRQRLRKEQRRLQDLKDNPPVPQDTVIRFWPRKGSRYMEEKKEEGK